MAQKLAEFSSGAVSFERNLRALVDDKFASRLADRDAQLWGRDAVSEASKRLGWVDLSVASRPLVAEIEQFAAELRERGLIHVVLCGMGGSSLAPEVICRAAGVALTVLDSSQPDMVRTAMTDRLEQSVVVVASKSGGTVETDSQLRAYEQAFKNASRDPAGHIVIVTDPGSPFAEYAEANGYRTFLADPEVGGRYSALTAFGLVPSGLAGAPIGTLLDEAEVIREHLFSDSVENLGLRLGALLGTGAINEVDKLVLSEDNTSWGLGDWIEQLVAESTGKEHTGILPVVGATAVTDDSIVVALGDATLPLSPSGFAAAIDLPLGAQMMLWEVATAAAGRVLDINPFDQPDVESAKQAARALLTGASEPATPDFTDGVIEGRGTTHTDVTSAIAGLLAEVDRHHGYLAIHAYLDRWEHHEFAAVADLLAAHIGRPVTFGWGPRFLHSTGQFHKGGTPNGVFLQVTADPKEDLPVPGREFTFGSFIASQAAGDARVLRDRGRPVLSLHLTNVYAGIEQLKGLLT